MNFRNITTLAALLAAAPVLGMAQETAVVVEEAEAAAPAFDEIGPYIMTTLLFLVGGFLVFWMAAGFAMLEAGLVRSKNVTTQLTKNIALFSIAGIMYWLVGFNLMYPAEWMMEGYMGPFFQWTALEPVGLGAADASLDYASVASDFFFQLMFCATTASIVSGTLAERIKLWPFLIFVVVLTGFIYPIEASWQWGGGWLSEAGFYDFAGSTLVHAAGGFAALAGAIVLGPRIGKYAKDGRVVPMPGSNLALATLGTFILWMGWFGFNGGSQLKISNFGDANAVAAIFVNTNMAAAGGVVAALLTVRLIWGKADLTMALNGALAGLVAITAEPLAPSPLLATCIGAVGGILVVFSITSLDRMKIDDPVGAISVHLVCGIWGTLAVGIFGVKGIIATGSPDQLINQLIGIGAIGLFTVAFCLVLGLLLKFTIGIRVSPEEEQMGLDLGEHGISAYSL